MAITRSQKDIDDVMNWAVEGMAQGTRFLGMSYEQGVDDALRWATGLTDERPDQDE